MKKIVTLFVFLFASLTINNLHAGSSSITQYAPVVTGNGETAGLAELTRNEQGIHVQLHGIELIESGHAFTAWVDIDDNNDGSERILVRIAGGVSGDSQEIQLVGSLSRGNIPPENGFSILYNNGNGVFNHPMEAKIGLFIRDHGEIIPDLLNNQVTQLNGGCEPSDPNICENILFIQFAAP